MAKADKPLTLKELLTAVKVALKPLENKLGDIETRIVQMDIRLDRRITKLEGRLDKIEVRLDNTETKQDEQSEKVDTLILVTHETNESVKGLWDKIDIVEEKTTNEIKKIKKRIGLASN